MPPYTGASLENKYRAFLMQIHCLCQQTYPSTSSIQFYKKEAISRQSLISKPGLKGKLFSPFIL
jgi:hypothetical protein